MRVDDPTVFSPVFKQNIDISQRPWIEYESEVSDSDSGMSHEAAISEAEDIIAEEHDDYDLGDQRLLQHEQQPEEDDRENGEEALRVDHGPEQQQQQQQHREADVEQEEDEEEEDEEEQEEGDINPHAEFMVIFIFFWKQGIAIKLYYLSL